MRAGRRAKVNTQRGGLRGAGLRLVGRRSDFSTGVFTCVSRVVSSFLGVRSHIETKIRYFYISKVQRGKQCCAV